jgi:hypothetical protein
MVELQPSKLIARVRFPSLALIYISGKQVLMTCFFLHYWYIIIISVLFFINREVKMKKIFCVVFILCAFFLSSLYSKEKVTEMWTSLYKKSVTLAEKKQKMEQIANIATTDFTDLIKDALTEEAGYPPITDPKERKTLNELIYKTFSIAEKLKMPLPISLFENLYYRLDESRYKGELIFTMGKLGDKAMIPWLNNEMNNMNKLQKNGEILGKEEIVEGLVRALTLYKDQSSFPYLFYASLPNYPEKIRKLALTGLTSISNEPANLCTDYIKTETDFNMILEALKFASETNSPNEHKILTAKTALIKSMNTQIFPSPDIETQRKLKDNSVYYLGILKADNPEIFKLISDKWNSDVSSKSNIITIEALQKIGSNDAVGLLREKLAFITLNAKKGGGVSVVKDDNGEVIIAIIRALGVLGNQDALEELMDVKLSVEFGKPIIDEAEKAIIKLQKK